MVNKKTFTIAYKADDINSVNDLELSCERDEAQLGKLVNIELAKLETSNGAKAVACTYEKVPLGSGINRGELTFQEYSNVADANVKTANLLVAQATPVLPGDSPDANKSRAKIYVGNSTKKILVFRDKAN